jgi:PPP family 3-phenylpropionic acid transporter
MKLLPLFITTFVVYAAVTPYLPLLIRGLGYSPAIVGILLGIFEGAGIVGPFVFGHWADKLGRYRSGLIITYVLTILAVIPLVLCINPWISALLIAVLAIGFRSTIPLLDAVTTIKIGKTGDYGKIRTFGSISFIVMTLFFQWTSFLRPNTSANIALWIGISSALAIVPAALFPSKYINVGPRPPRAASAPGRFRTPLFILGFTMIMLCRVGMAPVYSFFPLYLVEFMNWDAVGIMFALSSAAEVPCMFISHRLIQRYGALPLLAASAAAIAVRLGIYAFIPLKAGIVAAQLLHALCFGIFHPAAIALIAGSVPPEHRALGMSLYLSLGTGLPSLLANSAGGFIVEHAGYPALFASYSVFPVLAALLYPAARIIIRRKGLTP